MQRLNTGYFYRLGWQVHPLIDIDVESKWSDWYLKLVWSRNVLEEFKYDPIIPAPLSKQAAANLVLAIDNALPSAGPSQSDMDDKVGDSVYDIFQRFREFEHVLAAELMQIETFVTAQKGIFDTKSLVDYAENMFSDEVRKWLSEQAVIDIRQAGRCLAFEIPTAAGFHLARAVEDSIRRYYEVVTQKPYDKGKQLHSWGNYISALDAKGADKKVLSALDQMRELHRNPISHPDVNLSTDEAMILVGLVQSAIVAMVADCQRREPKSLVKPQVS